MTTATENGVACEWCGEPATLRDTTQGDASCETCARDQFGFRRGEAYVVGYMIEQVIEIARLSGASQDEIRDAVDRALKGGEPTLGAELDLYRAIEMQRKAGEHRPESDRYLAHFEPLVEGGEA
jgi:hypothetical protein